MLSTNWLKNKKYKLQREHSQSILEEDATSVKKIPLAHLGVWQYWGSSSLCLLLPRFLLDCYKSSLFKLRQLLSSPLRNVMHLENMETIWELCPYSSVPHIFAASLQIFCSLITTFNLTIHVVPYIVFPPILSEFQLTWLFFLKSILFPTICLLCLIIS